MYLCKSEDELQFSVKQNLLFLTVGKLSTYQITLKRQWEPHMFETLLPNLMASPMQWT